MPLVLLSFLHGLICHQFLSLFSALLCSSSALALLIHLHFSRDSFSIAFQGHHVHRLDRQNSIQSTALSVAAGTVNGIRTLEEFIHVMNSAGAHMEAELLDIAFDFKKVLDGIELDIGTLLQANIFEFTLLGVRSKLSPSEKWNEWRGLKEDHYQQIFPRDADFGTVPVARPLPLAPERLFSISKIVNFFDLNDLHFWKSILNHELGFVVTDATPFDWKVLQGVGKLQDSSQKISLSQILRPS